ncbi:unnamed protein product [Closterium sp. Naga37s-1]|nr:unnamed protein product [Closterium sp. Naga37s-1]
MRTALSAWLTSSTVPPDGHASRSNHRNSVYNGDGSPAVSVSWEDWQRAYEQARGAEGRQQQQEGRAEGRKGEEHAEGIPGRQPLEAFAKGVGVGSSRGEQGKGRDAGSGRGGAWQRAYEHKHPESRSSGSGYQEARAGVDVEGGAEGWGRTVMDTGGGVGRGVAGAVGAVRECVSLDLVPERLLVKFQQSLGLYRLGFNFQVSSSHEFLYACAPA